jgi:hypothetical protein
MKGDDKIIICSWPPMLYGARELGFVHARSRLRQARRLLLELCHDVRGGSKSLAEIGMELGDVGATALCRNRKIFEEDLEADRELARIYEPVLASFRR